MAANDEAEAETFTSEVAQALQQVALAYPEVTETPSCVNRSFKARKKSFLFLGEKPDGMLRLMVKLEDAKTIAEAEAAAKDNPDGWSVNGPGWITGNFTNDTAPAVETMTGWIDESFRLLAPKTLLKQLDSAS